MACPDDFANRFGELFELAYGVAYKLTGDRGESEDIAQETLARALVRWRHVRGYDRPWVARVAANQAIDRQRRDARARPVRAVAMPSGDDERMLDRLALVAELRRLPNRQRQVIVLRYVADLTEAEVAKVLGCSLGTVKQHASRGLAALRSDVVPAPVEEAGSV